jgi:glycosyltransferase involved in cell wall biosynthesis
MKSIAIPHSLEVQSTVHPKRLLMVGPKPPPIGGSPLTMQAMLAELALYPGVEVAVINTSPATDVRKKMTGFNLEKVARTVQIVPQYLARIRHCDAVVVFANDFFSITLVPILLFVARLFGKPFFLKPVAASLDLFINAQKPPLRAYLLAVLRSTDGILAQTQRLRQDLGKLGCGNVHYLPGCRPLGAMSSTEREPSTALRLIFLAHITRLKGPLVLLDALRQLEQNSDREVRCDFFGPIHDEIREEFMSGLQQLPNVRYCGVAEAGTGPELISKYDALVLPTYFDTEGHPGVLIEAMHAGVPVISTQIRTLPELVTNGVNGFLVPTQDSEALAEAILQLAADRELVRKMGEANRRKGQEFRADAVVAQMLKIVFPNVAHVRQARAS